MATNGKNGTTGAPPLRRELDVRPPGLTLLGVRGPMEDARPWLSELPSVPALQPEGIAHAGVITAPEGFQIVRTRLSGAYFIGTLSGTGRVYLNSRWMDCGPGHAVLLMPGVLNALYTPPGQTWTYCWLRFAAGAGPAPGPADREQVISEWNSEPLHHALLGLRAEALGLRDPAALRRWAEQVADYVRLFRRQGQPDPRVVRLWTEVEKNIAAEWTSSDMCRVASLSAEHLRRLCHAACGRGPHAHLMYLRMKRASTLLLGTDWTIERIAEEVGYRNAFVFSTAFKKVIGWPPSTYARRNELR